MNIWEEFNRHAFLIHDKHNHLANMLAIVIPSTAFWSNLPEYITAATGILGCIWYLVLFWGKFIDYQERKRNHSHRNHNELWEED